LSAFAMSWQHCQAVASPLASNCTSTKLQMVQKCQQMGSLPTQM